MGEGLTKWLELNGVSTDTLKLLLGCAVVVALVIVIAAIFSKVRSAQREDLFRVQKLEAMESFNRLEKTGKLPATQTNIILQKGEVALLDEPTTFCEARSYRVGGGAGTRIGGVYIGGGVSESQQRLKQIDTGRLILTSKRLIFDGSLENRTVRLPDIVSVERWQDAIEVSTQRRAKSQVFQVVNPIVWATMIEQVASGKIAPS